MPVLVGPWTPAGLSLPVSLPLNLSTEKKKKKSNAEAAKTAQGMHAARREYRSTCKKEYSKRQRKKAERQFQKLLSTRPCVGQRSVFRTGDQPKGIPAVRHPSTGTICTDASDILDALHKYYSEQAAPAFEPRTGRYLPGEAPRNYPWDQPGGFDKFTLSKRTDPALSSQLPSIADTHKLTSV